MRPVRGGEEDGLERAPKGGHDGKLSGHDGPAPTWWFLDTCVVEHHAGCAGRSTVLEMTLPEGAAPPAHIHHGYDDSFFVLDGELVVRNGDRVRVAGAGDWVSTPKGTPHAFRVVGGRAARILIVLDHPSFVELIHELGEPAPALTLPPSSRSPGADRVFRAFAAHDVEVVGGSITDDEAASLLAGLG